MGRNTTGTQPAQPQEGLEPVADEWRTPDTEALVDAILRLDDSDDALRFLRDLCTLGELHDLAQRWAVVRLLDAGLHYADISRRTGASTATITRIASWLNHGEGGYRAMLDRLKAGDGAGPDASGAQR
jgi:TrpR-related protein YerC/YecD